MYYDIIGSDVIDSRSVIERISELESQDSEDDGSGLDGTEREELIILQEFAESASEVSDWEFGETFIRDDYFTEYAQQLADDIDAINNEPSWPLTYIDWDAAARALQQDYTSYELDGITYWARY